MASKTNYLDLTGTVSWCNTQFGGLFSEDPKYGGYKVTMYPDPKSWEAYKKAGIRLKTHNDENGDYIVFRRRATQMMGNKLETFGPPKVFFNEGIEPTKDIGNGSSATVSIEYFDTKNGTGHRLNRVVITDLVKYESTSGNRFDDSKLRTLDDATPSAPSAPQEPNVMDKEELEGSDFNDAVPFPNESVAPIEEPKVVKKMSPFRR